MKRVLTISIILLTLAISTSAQSRSAITDPITKMIKVYPTPAASSINFDFQRGFDKNYSLQLYNFMGKKVYEVKTTSQTYNLPLADFYRGIYVYQLRDKDGKILQSGKFQVIK